MGKGRFCSFPAGSMDGVACTMYVRDACLYSMPVDLVQSCRLSSVRSCVHVKTTLRLCRN